MNSAIRPVSDAAKIIEAETKAQPVVLYPGDTWTIGESINNDSAIARYATDLESLATRQPETSESVSISDLQQTAERFSATVTQQRSWLRLRLNSARMNARHQRRLQPHAPLRAGLAGLKTLLTMQVRPAKIWLTDHGVSLDYSLIRGLETASRDRDDCDIELSSAALMFSFKFLWGGESLQINGRFHEMYPDGRIPLFEYLWVACAMNRESGVQARPL